LAEGGSARVVVLKAREGRGRGGERTQESGSPQGARIVGRLQKSVRRIFLAPCGERDVVGQPRAKRAQAEAG